MIRFGKVSGWGLGHGVRSCLGKVRGWGSVGKLNSLGKEGGPMPGDPSCRNGGASSTA